MEYYAIVCACVVLHLPNCAVEGSIRDLTHYYDDHVIRWPGHKPWVYNLNRKPFVTITNKTLWLESNDMSTAEHMGTHIDAPAHLYKGAKRLDEIPLEDLIAPVVVIDVQEKAKWLREYALSIEDVMDHEKKHGQIPEGAAVFMNSGWDQYWFEHNKARFLGTISEDIWELQFPGFHPDTAEWLINNRNIKGIGSDTVSFDVGSEPEGAVHTTIFAHNVWGLENLAHLGKVPPAGATVHVFPMNIWQASGAPSRVVAFWDDNDMLCAATSVRWSTLLLAALILFALCG